MGVDLFQLRGCDYMVTVDYYSNLWEVDELSTTTSAMVIKKLKAHNGPQFISEEFHTFMIKWDIEHRTSSPGRPQGNGMAAVKMAKNIIKKAADSNQDPFLAILEYRNVPTQDAGSSPAQRMLVA